MFIATNFYMLLLARFIQAFGASVGSVVTQTIMRESFEGKRGVKVFSIVGAAMSLSPAIGPLIGGIAQTYFGYKSVFSILIGMSILVLLYSYFRLPETRIVQVQNKEVSYIKVTKRLLKDPKILTYGLLIGGINGVLFSYYAEAPFIFINHFNMSAAIYGTLGMILAISSIVGAMISSYLVNKKSSEQVIYIGLIVSVIFATLFIVSSLINVLWLILMTIFGMFLGLNIALPNVLNIALIGYEDDIGTASGIFSFGYYIVVSLFTYLMSVFHDGTILSLPIYVFVIIVIMLTNYKLVVKIKD
ncbi:MFS transporter [Companilactobacillus sp. DQM5]|uniref:MFS transporter n=1 Tax=Companilactobacillus sp. DQM5 TaxID=3463359 RepID=UPI0040585718